MKHPILISPRTQNDGFALVVSLSLMVLLTIIAVGLLTLSTISLRTSTRSEDLATARANARLALILALGDLQKHSGTDTRVTARADILDEDHPPVTGVWKSWEGSDHSQSGSSEGRPISPGNYASKKEDRFLAWLVSGDPAAAKSLPDTGKSASKAVLLGEGSVGGGAEREKQQIHLSPTLLPGESKKGAYAWWIGGENQKARLPKPYQPTEDNNARWAVHAKSHSVVDPKPFGMEQLLEDPGPALKAISLKQSDLLPDPSSDATSTEHFHDLSTTSVGLLTNVATGGWKKDLSLLTENWAAPPIRRSTGMVPSRAGRISRTTSSPTATRGSPSPRRERAASSPNRSRSTATPTRSSTRSGSCR